MRLMLSAVAPLLLITLLGCDNTFDAAAANPSAETVRQYVESGWMPHGVPQNLRAVKVNGDTDTERYVGTFTSDATDAFLAKCQLDKDGFVVETGLPKWFPEEVRTTNSSDTLRAAGYETYNCADDFAVIRKGTDKTVWFWSDREDDD